MVHYVMFPGGGTTSNSVILILQWPWWVVTITTIIIVMIIMIIPLIVVVLYYWMFFFLSLDDLLHLETSLIFSVPQKDFSNGKTKQNNPSLGYLHLSSDPHLSTSSTETSVFFDRGFHKRGSVTWTWCSLRPTWPFIMTVFSPVHGLCTLLIRSLLVYLPLSPHSVIVCSPNRILVSCIFTDVVDNSYSDS